MARMMRMLLVLLLFILTGPAQAAAAQTTAPAHTTGMGDALRQGERLARELTLTTGVAVSPLLGVVLLGAGHYFTAAEADRPALPWHASPRFWGSAAVLLGLLFLKDSSKVALPKLLVAPLDALAAASGLPGAILGGGATLAIYAVIWVCSQAGNVLILLSPSSLLDSLLIAAKTTIAVLLLGLAGTLPGQLLALVLVLLALRLFPRALRLVVFGTLVSQDLVRHRLLGRPVPSPAADRPVRCFTSCRLGGLPLLTCGRLGVQDGALAFSWRPLMVGRERTVQTTIDPATCTLGRGFLSPVVCWRDTRAAARVQLFRLLPATAAHLDLVAAQLGVRGQEETSVRSRLAEGWRWCRSLFAPAAVIRVEAKEAG